MHAGAVVLAEVFYKIDVLKKPVKSLSLCFNKVAGIELVTSNAALLAPDQKDLFTHRDVLYKKGVLENVSKFTGKRMC